MESILQIFRKNTAFLSIQNNVKNLTEKIQPHISQLQNFQFYFNNPLFVGLLVLLILILSRKWGIKKAFSYCACISVFLYLATKVMAYLNIRIMEESEITYADLAKGMVVFVVIIITIYYSAIRNE